MLDTCVWLSSHTSPNCDHGHSLFVWKWGLWVMVDLKRRLYRIHSWSPLILIQCLTSQLVRRKLNENTTCWEHVLRCLLPRSYQFCSFPDLVIGVMELCQVKGQIKVLLNLIFSMCCPCPLFLYQRWEFWNEGLFRSQKFDCSLLFHIASLLYPVQSPNGLRVKSHAPNYFSYFG